MKKILVLVAALLMVAGFTTVQAAGPFCFDMTVYCDGMELSLNNQQITGFWVNTDCAGADVPVTGRVFNGPLGQGGYWFGSVGGFQWAFFAATPLTGSMAMYQWDGTQWVVWIPAIAYTVAPGPCPFDDYIGDPRNSTTWVE
jgi:hypothetical protein